MELAEIARKPSATIMSTPLPNSGETSALGPDLLQPHEGALFPPDLKPFTTEVMESLKFNDDLKLVTVELDRSVSRKYARKMVKAVHDDKNFLPGQPRVLLDVETRDGAPDPLLSYLRESHNTKQLDELLPYMRYIFTETPSSDHILPLHHQKAHARVITVTENPGLHLVWYYDIIFVKPIPAYFYSPAIWEFLENADSNLYRTSLGFMRSYHMLIRYKIDFVEACRLQLIPEKSNGQLPTYEEWCKFMEPFARVGNYHVNLRYKYGEIRLTRLNRAAMLFGYGLKYYQYRLDSDWKSFMEHTLAPLVTAFAVCTVILNSMQVSLAALAMADAPPDAPWPVFVGLSVWFPVVVLVAIVALLVYGLLAAGADSLAGMIRTNRVRKLQKLFGRPPPMDW